MVTVVYSSGGKVQRLSLAKFPATIGRARSHDVVIRDDSVSSHHATIERDNSGRTLYIDQGSTNGTFYGAQRVRKLVLDDDVDLTVGNVRVRFEVSGARAGTPTSHVAPEKPTYYIRQKGKEDGPFTLTEMRAKLRTGVLNRADLVWQEGASSWTRADVLPELMARDKKGAGGSLPLPPGPGAAPRPADLNKPAPTPAPAPAPQPQPEARAKRHARRKGGDITCPHCWHQFGVEEFLYIARHQSLVGDPVLGPDAPQRFLPSKFTPEGNAVDSAGTSCPDMACPHCHLRVPRNASEQPPLFLSIVGAAASGKSFFLTSMIWTLRNRLSRNFAIAFTDTDAINNQIINDCEEVLFLNSAPDELVALRKTELQGELYNQVLLDGMLISLPKPFMFTINPAEHHPQYEEVREKMFRTLVLYDNAGEHFEPGMDSVDNPTTRHLLHSDMVFFLFDPTQDMRFRNRLESNDPQLSKGARVQRQEILLTEMINRIKKYSGLRASSKTVHTLVILVSKADVWLHLLGFDVPAEPWGWVSKFNTCALDVNMVKNVSFAVRALLDQLCPEVVSTAESFAGDVLYLPDSSLGRSPELNEETGMLGIRPKDIVPFWVDVPMLYFFYERGFVPPMPKDLAVSKLPAPVEVNAQASGDVVFVSFEQDKQPLQVPAFYCGSRIRDPQTGMWFDVPESTKGNSRR